MALDCDGIDDLINHGNVASGSPTQLTHAYWAFPDALTVVQRLLDKVDVIINWSRDAAADQVFTVDGGNTYGKLGSALTVGQWDHWAWVFDGSLVGNARLALYKNGAVQTLTYTGTQPASVTASNANYQIAGAAAPGRTFCDMKFAHLLVWVGTALSAADVANQMNMTRPVRTDNLKIWSPYDDGTSATDYSGAGNNGAVTGALQAAGPPVSYGGSS